MTGTFSEEYLNSLDPFYADQIRQGAERAKMYEQIWSKSDGKVNSGFTHDFSKDCDGCTEKLYQGERNEKGLRHGKGRFEFFWDGSVYEGDWVDDKRHGFGKHTWLNGASYTGEYANDRREGFGTYVYPSGGVYTGQYKDNKPHGKGRHVFKGANDGDVYEGDHLNGLKHGHGTLVYNTGEKYVGEWLHSGTKFSVQNSIRL